MGQGRILIVDDEVSIVDTLAELLRQENFAVATAGHGYDALSLLQNFTPDVVLLDIWLPELDGIETLQALRVRCPAVPVIMMSGHANIETAVQVTRLGAFDYLEKPFSAKRVLAAVRHACDRPYTSPQEPQSHPYFPPVLVGTSPHMNHIRRRFPLAWQQDAVVTLHGERGSGKTLVARLIHQGSLRREGPFVLGHCEQMSATTAGPLLFGSTHQAANGESVITKGYLELANGGTLFLSQIDCLPLVIQQQLAQSLTAQSLQRVGGTIPIPLNIRLLASSVSTIAQWHASETLHPSLSAHLQGLSWELAPLRHHRDDIPALAQYFLQMFAHVHNVPLKQITAEAMQCLMAYTWPENVAELKRLTEQLILTTPTSVIDFPTLPKHLHDTHPVCATARYGALMPPRPTSWACASGATQGRHTQSPSVHHQRTLQRSVVLYGRGLQSGLKTGMTLSPLPPHSGILFRNIATGYTFPSSVDFVTSTDFCTSLCQERFVARTVEHLLSSLHAYRITNLLIKISDEIPIMDGSARDFCQLLEDAGIVEQSAAAEEFVVDRCYSIGQIGPESKFILVEPYDGFRVTYRLHYPPPLGVQELVYEHTGSASYTTEIAPARTFGFVREVEKLHQMGLLGGGRLNNVILVDHEKVVNSTPLRFPDEFVRHKILDLMGDFYLLGRPIRGHIQANMTGHTENIALVKKLRDIIQ